MFCCGKAQGSIKNGDKRAFEELFLDVKDLCLQTLDLKPSPKVSSILVNKNGFIVVQNNTLEQAYVRLGRKNESDNRCVFHEGMLAELKKSSDLVGGFYDKNSALSVHLESEYNHFALYELLDMYLLVAVTFESESLLRIADINAGKLDSALEPCLNKICFLLEQFEQYR
eukprot:Nk52_evm90s1444 gene=Nk52_evmTU90s1444